MENKLSIIQYNKDLLIVQANELIRSMQDDLTLLEVRLIKLVIAQIVESDTELYTYTCNVSDLAKYLEISPDNIYRDIDNLSSSILTKRVYMRDKTKPNKKNGKPNYNKFQWVSAFKYNNGVITIRLNSELKPWLLGLYTYFTTEGYDSFRKLPTYNATRLFDLLKSYSYSVNTASPRFKPSTLFPHIEKADNELIFSIEYLRGYFNCNDKYPANKDFILRIIESCVNSINKESAASGNMYVSYRTAKEGRKIGYVLFKINAWKDEDFREYVRKSGAVGWSEALYNYAIQHINE